MATSRAPAQANFFAGRFEDHHGWLSWLHETLPKPNLDPDAPVVIDLFAGCGGLALGFEAQGFRTVGYEMKPVAVRTYNANLDGRCEETFLKIGMPEGKADILIGGPPCQPFSQIGYQRGSEDPRDGFPVFLDAVRRIEPRIAIIENVRGLLFRNKDYLRNAATEFERLGYVVHVNIAKAREYGVPQNRERVVVVASKVGWSWPAPAVFSPVTVRTALGPLMDEYRSILLYLGDTEKKILALDEQALSKLGLAKPSRSMLPDILAYDRKRKWLLVIEAVHSSNPIGALRHRKLRELTKDCTVGRVYISAFADAKTFRRFSGDISWQTEVWIADDPEHLIHFDGERYLGPYENTKAE